jgi:hypothetical protein
MPLHGIDHTINRDHEPIPSSFHPDADIRLHADWGVFRDDYFEHVVRDERELRAIRQYITDNPAHWDIDRDNSEGHSGLPVPSHINPYLADLKYETV